MDCATKRRTSSFRVSLDCVKSTNALSVTYKHSCISVRPTQRKSTSKKALTVGQTAKTCLPEVNRSGPLSTSTGTPPVGFSVRNRNRCLQIQTWCCFVPSTQRRRAPPPRVLFTHADPGGKELPHFRTQVPGSRVRNPNLSAGPPVRALHNIQGPCRAPINDGNRTPFRTISSLASPVGRVQLRGEVQEKQAQLLLGLFLPYSHFLLHHRRDRRRDPLLLRLLRAWFRGNKTRRY